MADSINREVMFLSCISCRESFRSDAWILGRLTSSVWNFLAWITDASLGGLGRHLAWGGCIHRVIERAVYTVTPVLTTQMFLIQHRWVSKHMKKPIRSTVMRYGHYCVLIVKAQSMFFCYCWVENAPHLTVQEKHNKNMSSSVSILCTLLGSIKMKHILAKKSLKHLYSDDLFEVNV